MSVKQTMKKQHQVVIIGGGTGGSAVAARLLRAQPSLDLAVIDPSPYHYYQPAWTLVGGGAYRFKDTQRSLKACLPKAAKHIQVKVVELKPDINQVVLDDGQVIEYQYLVVAAGIELHWGGIKGLTQALGSNGVTSNYHPDYAAYTWELVENFNGGSAVFTQPSGPIKCPGAPQKAVYLSADYFKKHNIKADVTFRSAAAGIFGVAYYAEPLNKVMAESGATAHFKSELIEVRGEQKIAVFKTTHGEHEQIEEVAYDILHAVPPQRAPKFIRNSPLANGQGWLELDKHTLAHVGYKNIFGLGDCSSTPNSKTAAAIKNQAPVVAKNVLQALSQQQLSASYGGYAACPLTTAHGKVLLAEFSYGGKITPSFPGDPRKPRRRSWWIKRRFLPYFYWNYLVKGKDFPIKTLRLGALPVTQTQASPAKR